MFNTCALCNNTLHRQSEHFTANVYMFGTQSIILAHAHCLSLRSSGEQARWTPGVCV